MNQAAFITMLKNRKNMKLRVNEEQGVYVQNICADYNVFWGGISVRYIQRMEMDYLYITFTSHNKGIITYGVHVDDAAGFYVPHPNYEVFLDKNFVTPFWGTERINSVIKAIEDQICT